MFGLLIVLYISSRISAVMERSLKLTIACHEQHFSLFKVTCAGLRKLEKAERKLRNLEGSAGALVSKGTAKTERRWKKISEGWLPRQDDKFFHLAACSSIEKAWEGLDHRTNRHCGLFTSTLGDILEDWDETRGNLSYNALSR